MIKFSNIVIGLILYTAITLTIGPGRPEQPPQNASDCGLNCLPLFSNILDTSTDSKMDLVKSYDILNIFLIFSRK